jgi:hypothetical protein
MVTERYRDTAIVDDKGRVRIARVIERRRTLHHEWDISSDAFNTSDEPRKERLVVGNWSRAGTG